MKLKILVLVVLLLTQIAGAEIISETVQPNGETFEVNETFITGIRIVNGDNPLFVEINKTNESFEQFEKVRSYQLEYNSTNKNIFEFDIGIDNFEKWDSWESLSSMGKMGAYSGKTLKEQGFGLIYPHGNYNKTPYYISTFTLNNNKSSIYFVADEEIQNKVTLAKNPKTGSCNYILRLKEGFKNVTNCSDDSQGVTISNKNILYIIILLAIISISYLIFNRRQNPNNIYQSFNY